MTTKTDFARFQKYFTEYQKRLGLSGYKVYFKHEPIEDAFADICVQQRGMVVTVRLNSKLGYADKPHKNIRGNARHEAIHLLTHRLEARARDRYVSSDEIYEAVEELARRIDPLLDS